jgi:N-acetylglucosamine-6-phosphate deacetylase
MRQVADRARSAMACDECDRSAVLGLYAEGPFQQPDLTGASLALLALPPTPANVRHVIDDLGSALTMINVAPGLEGDVAAIHQFREVGKVVSMAHSNAPADRVLSCVSVGTSVLGHIWDNNSGLIGDSGVQQATLEHVALVDDRVRFIHLICDGVHADALMVQLLLRCRGVEAVCLVTDSNIRSGCPDGTFRSDDGRTWEKKGGVIRTETGWLAGSALLLPDMFRNFVRLSGLPPAKAIRAVTFNPACCLNLQDHIGLLAPGMVADLVVWDERLRVRRVFRLGHEIQTVSDLAEVSL